MVATPEHTTSDEDDDRPADSGTLPDTNHYIPLFSVYLDVVVAAYIPAHTYFI